MSCTGTTGCMRMFLPTMLFSPQVLVVDAAVVLLARDREVSPRSAAAHVERRVDTQRAALELL